MANGLFQGLGFCCSFWVEAVIPSVEQCKGREERCEKSNLSASLL